MNKENIYIERKRLGEIHQPSYKNESLLLDKQLSDLGRHHPYDSLNESEFECFENCCQNFGNINIKCMPLYDNQEFLYRIMSVSLLGKYTTRWKIPSIDEYNFFDEIRHENSSWTKLDKYLFGFINNRRGFSWWTNTEPTNLESIFQLGIVSDWINPQSVVLRVNTKKTKIKKLKPSIVEGFQQPVFMPQSEETNRPGKTLNLNNMTNFEGGLDEYIISEIRVDDIDFKPLYVDRKIKMISLNDIIPNLFEYFKNK